MVTRLAKRLDSGRRRRTLTVVHSSAGRLGGTSRLLQRRQLVCRWRQVPGTGRLECHWQLERIDAASPEEPDLVRSCVGCIAA
jgi:hypothetical protein